MVSDAGQSQTLSCVFAGNPEPEVEWFRKNILIGSGNRFHIEAVDQADVGEFECRARSEMGEVVEVVELVVRGPPQITSPNAQNSGFECAFVSEPAPLAVHVIDLTSSAIVFSTEDGSTDSIKLDLPQGHYECQVENEFGQVSSLIHISSTGKTENDT